MKTGKYVVKNAASSKYNPSTSFIDPHAKSMSSSGKMALSVSKNPILPLLEEKENVSSIAASASAKVASHSSLSIIPGNIHRIHTKDEPHMRTEYAVISHDQFRALPKGTDGFQGVVPWYMGQNGSIEFVLNISEKNRFLGYIGGGLSPKEKPIDGLYREIKEETPQWSDYLIGLLENPAHPRLIVVKEKYNPDHKGKKIRFRLSTTIYVRVDPAIINEETFRPSDEVNRLHLISSDELPWYEPVNNYVFNPAWAGTENGLSNGINDVVEMIMTPSLFHYLWGYIKHNITKAEYIYYLQWLFEKNNVSNVMVWKNSPKPVQVSLSDSNSNSNSLSKSLSDSLSKPPSTPTKKQSTSKSSKKKKSGKKTKKRKQRV